MVTLPPYPTFMGWGVLTKIAPPFFTIKRLKPLDSKAFDGVVTPSGPKPSIERFGQETKRGEGLAVIGDIYCSIQQPAVFQTTTVCFQGYHPASDQSIPPISQVDATHARLSEKPQKDCGKALNQK